MAQQGLFTQGPSIDDLLQKRNTRASDLQRQLMQQASQGAARPMETQAASLIGSSLGRALAGAMDGGRTREKLEAEQAKQSQAQGQYLEAAKGGSREMFEQVAVLQKTYPAAAVKMLALAKEAKKEEDAAAAAVAQATADAEEATRVQNLAAQKIIDDKAAVTKKYEIEAQVRKEARVETLRKEGVAADVAKAQAEAEEEANKKVVISGADYNAKYKGQLSEGSMWLLGKNGDMEQIDKSGETTNINIDVPLGMRPVTDDAGKILRYEPIENGPQWLAARKLEAEEAAAEAREAHVEGGKKIKNTVVSHALQTARDISALDSLTTPIFGKLGLAAVSGGIEGTERSDMEAAVKTLKAQSGFSSLQAMRDSSKTGGALGAINKEEMTLLVAALGSLELSQSKEQFDKNLDIFEQVYYDTVNGSGSWDKQSANATTSATYTFDPTTGNMVLSK